MFFLKIIMTFVFGHLGDLLPLCLSFGLAFLKNLLFVFRHVLHAFFVDAADEPFRYFTAFPVRHAAPVGKELFPFFCQLLALFRSQFAGFVHLLAMFAVEFMVSRAAFRTAEFPVMMMSGTPMVPV